MQRRLRPTLKTPAGPDLDLGSRFFPQGANVCFEPGPLELPVSPQFRLVRFGSVGTLSPLGGADAKQDPEGFWLTPDQNLAAQE